MKKRTIVRVFVFLFVLALAGIAFAAGPEGAAHESFFKEWGWKIINFLLIAAIIVYFARKPFAQFLKGRTEAIQKSLDEARTARELSEKALRDVEERLRLKDQEIAGIIAASTRSGEVEREALIKEAERMSRKVMEQARANVDFELKRARDAIRQEAAELAVELAERKLKEKLTPGEQKKLLEESLAKLEGKI